MTVHRLRASLLGTTALLLGSMVAASSARAQGTVTVGAFLESELTGTAVQNLAFGTAAPGATRTVQPQMAAGCTGCTAAQWIVNNLSSAAAANRQFIRITFVALPSLLTHSSGTTTMGITWSNAARACLLRNGAEYHCYAAWTPAAGTPHSLRINPDPAGQKGARDLRVYLGGTIAPPANQRAGIYAGTVTLQLAYGST